jgi:citrate synthase
MTVKNLFSTVLTIASLTTIGGAIAKKPLLINLGINAGLSSGIGHLVVKQNQQALQKQQLALSNQSTQSELANIEATLAKHQKQLKQQITRQNLTLSKVSKLDHQQKVTAIAISQQVDKLIDISQNNESNVVTKNLAADKKVKSSANVTAIRQPVTRVYIDGNNLSFAAKEMDIHVDFQALRLFLMPETGQASFNYYMGVVDRPTLGLINVLFLA